MEEQKSIERMEEPKLIERIIFAQPFEYKVEVSDRLNAKGDSQPEVKVQLSRKLENKEDVIVIVENDLKFAVERCRNAMKSMKEIS